jgi:hypothetical protein
VVPVDGLAQPGSYNVGVDLGGADVGVSEEGLDTAEIGAAFEKVRGESMTERMRRNGARKSGAEPVEG